MKITPRLKKALLIKACIKAVIVLILLVSDARANESASKCDDKVPLPSGGSVTGLADALRDLNQNWVSDGIPIELWVRSAEACEAVSQYSFSFHVSSQLPLRKHHGSPRFDVGARRFFMKVQIGADGFPRFSDRGLPPNPRLFFTSIREEGSVEENRIDIRATGYGSEQDLEIPPQGEKCARELARMLSIILSNGAAHLLDESRFGPNAVLGI